MTGRKLYLSRLLAGTVAIMALSAGAAFAQYDHRYSTPEERAETERLNESVAAAPPAVIDPQAQADYDAAQSQYDAQQQDYQSKVDDFQAQQNVYDNQVQDYQSSSDAIADQNAQYEEDKRAYDAAIADTAPRYPDESEPLKYPDERTLALGDVAARTLLDAPVESRGGLVVGRFHGMERGGAEDRAIIALDDHRMVEVGVRFLRFDPEHRLIVADLTENELRHAPDRF